VEFQSHDELDTPADGPLGTHPLNLEPWLASSLLPDRYSAAWQGSVLGLLLGLAASQNRRGPVFVKAVRAIAVVNALAASTAVANVSFLFLSM
jgi:hypothetical protein